MHEIFGQIDLSLVISIAALFLSVLFPVISGVLTGHYSVKIRKMEMEDARRQKIESEERQKREAEASAHQAALDRRNCVIRDYIRSAGRAYYGGGFAEFGENMSEIYLYFPPEEWFLLDEVRKGLEHENFGDYSESLTNFAKFISSKNAGGKI